MLRFLAKRILIMIPTFFGISLIVFFISINTPGDPVQLLMEKNSLSNGNESTKRVLDKKIEEISKQYHFNAPLFYFQITDQTQSDTLYKIANKQYRLNLSQISFEHGDWKQVDELNSSIELLSKLSYQLDDVPLRSRLLQFIEKLKRTRTIKGLIDQLLFLNHENIKNTDIRNQIIYIEDVVIKMASNTHKINRYLPKYIWFGNNNQYHYWITNLVSGDFGDSYFDNTPVRNKIKNAIIWTLILSILSIIISYSIAVPIGVYLAQNKDNKLTHLLNDLIFATHCIPSFWLASLLIIFLASPEYYQLFPSYGLGEYYDGQTLIDRTKELIPHLILPLVCFSYSSIAYIGEQTKRSILQIDNSDFVRTAKAKGLTPNSIYWKHMLKNTAFTLITQLGNLVPIVLSGSFVVEYIFAIPGMGKLLVDSISYRDYPTVFSTIMISSVLVMIGVLISDFLYMKLDPRVSLLNHKKG